MNWNPEMPAHRLQDLAARGPFRKTSLFKAIKDGQLKARKFGRATVVLDHDWREFLESLPVINPADRAA